jgi:hypothetical protein
MQKVYEKYQMVVLQCGDFHCGCRSGVFYGAGKPERPANKKPLILFRTRGLGETRLLWIMFWWRQRPLN